MSYGMFGRQGTALARKPSGATAEFEGEMANSKAHREKVKQQEEARAEQDRIVEAERKRRMKAEEDAAQKAAEDAKAAEAVAEEDKVRKAHLESDARLQNSPNYSSSVRRRLQNKGGRE